MSKRKIVLPKLDLEILSRQIYLVLGRRVMLDSDLAKLYGVTVSALNQAVQRNIERFPDDFAYRLTLQEFRDLKSQFVISSSETAVDKGLSDGAYGGRRKLPMAPIPEGNEKPRIGFRTDGG